mmetsp:Transcript_22294/g.34492  ORF Transcript_22294/g.34492 Transcript_22294/m.34492 type:complete len:110 (+) Transcript_22294:1696-2025(+)
MSNWERRPLRKTQQHYGALDAWILIGIVQKIQEKAKEDGLLPFEKYCKTLDNRNTIFHVPADDDFDEERYNQAKNEQVVVNKKVTRGKRQQFKKEEKKEPYGNTYGRKG